MRQATMRAEVIVVGGGLAGLTLAAALGGAGVDVLLVDREPAAVRAGEGYDGRTTAIAEGSRRILAGAGVWAEIEGAGAPILDIRIADGRAPVFLHYDHREVGTDPFGHIVENHLIRRGQFRLLERLPAVRHLAPATVAELERHPGHVAARLADGRRLAADLLVGADGRSSFVRKAAGIDAATWRYRQTAIVLTIAHEAPHHGLAVEHFLAPGPFAILPMTDAPDGRHRSSIVWTEGEARAAAMLGLDRPAFEEELGQRVGGHLGRVSAPGRRSSFPLGALHAAAYVAPRIALIGEAAHAIHPIAGQGLNLGLRDIAALAEIVVDRARLGLDLGEEGALARYQSWRRPDNLMLLAVTDGLNRLFSNRIPPVQAARGAGLAAVGRLPALKRLFMRQAMGTVGRLPRIARGERL